MEDKRQYAVIKTGGQQFKVTAGQKIIVNKLDAEKGASITITEVLLVSDGGNAPRVGTPYIEGASVTGTILGEFKDKKIDSFKRRRKKGYRRKIGHRQPRTALRIEQISLGA